MPPKKGKKKGSPKKVLKAPEVQESNTYNDLSPELGESLWRDICTAVSKGTTNNFQFRLFEHDEEGCLLRLLSDSLVERPASAPKFEVLDLSDNGLTAEKLRLLVAGCSCISPDTIILSGNELGPEGPKVLLEMLKNCVSTIRRIDMSGTMMTSEGIKSFGLIFSNELSKLKHIDLSDNGLDDIGLTLMSKQICFGCPLLRRMTLKRGHFTSASLETLGKAICNKENLRFLDLSWCGIDDASGELLLASLRTAESLRHIDLRHNNLGDKTGQELSRFLSNNRAVIRFDMQWNSVSDISMADLQSSIDGNPNVEIINLHSNLVSVDQMMILESKLAINRDPVLRHRKTFILEKGEKDVVLGSDYLVNENDPDEIGED